VRLMYLGASTRSMCILGGWRPNQTSQKFLSSIEQQGVAAARDQERVEEDE